MYTKHEYSKEEFLKLLGKRIRTIRLKKDISQTEIAYRCNFDKSSYNTIKAGKRNITVITLLKIASALDVKIIDFFKEDSI